MKIQDRMSINFTLLTASVLLIFSIVVYVLRANFREVSYYKRLHERANTFARFMVDTEALTDIPVHKFKYPNANAMYNEKNIALSASGSLIYDSNPAIKVDIPAGKISKTIEDREIEYYSGDYQIVGLAYHYNNQDFLVFTSALDRYGYNSLRNLFNILLISFVTSTAIIYYIGRRFSSRALQPIFSLIDQIDDIQGSNLDTRVYGGQNGDEIDYLADKFNSLLQRLNETFKVQNVIISGASHELRNPFASMIGQIDVTLLKQRSLSEYQQTLSSIREDVKRVSELTNQLLLLAQTNSQFAYGFNNDVRIDEIIWQAEAELRATHPEFQIDIKFAVESEDDTPYLVQCNPLLMRTAFMNLMDNACKYGSEPRVSVNIDYRHNLLIISFSDSAPRIPAEEHHLVFEPFYRSPQNLQHEGSGIGLALVRNIIQIHNGRVYIDIAQAGGNCFIVEIPRN